MSTSALGLILAAVLGLLAALHVFWAAGGRLGIVHTIPTDRGRPVIDPGPLLTLLVALLLLAAATICLMRSGWLDLPVPPWIPELGAWALALAFGLRALGDLRYVGLFKKVKGTPFARWDSRLFTPLCLLLALGCAILALAA